MDEGGEFGVYGEGAESGGCEVGGWEGDVEGAVIEVRILG